MKFYVKTSYYDDVSDFETFDSADEAGECYQGTIDQRRDLGMAFGDVSRISTGTQSSDGKLHVKAAVSFE